MKTEREYNDKRLLEAIDYIDSGLISEAMSALNIQDASSPAGSSRSGMRRTVTQTVVLAACLILLSAVFPIVSYVIGHADLFAGSMGTEAPETTSGMYDEYILTEEDLAELNEAYFRRAIKSAPELYADMSEAELNELRNSKFFKFAETTEQAMQRETVQNSRFYFGKYGDSIVVAFNGMFSMGYPVELCGYRFLYTNTTMLVCHDSAFYYMSEAFENGYLTESDIEKLHQTYIEYYSDIPDGLKIKTSGSPIELSDAESREIVWSYIKYSEDKDKLDRTYTVRCYGKFNGRYAVMIGVSGMQYTDEIRFERVYGVEFIFPNSQKMYVYSWGDFYGLSDYVLKEDEIMSIEWSKRAAFTYSESSAPVSLDKYEIEDILRAYVDLNETVGEKDMDFSLRCYGSFHENGRHVYVFFADRTGKTYPPQETVEEVNGLRFVYPTEQKLIVYPYDSREFFSLGEAFEAGLLTAEELLEVYTAYSGDK